MTNFKHLPGIDAGESLGHLKPTEASAGKDTVKMVFSQPLTLTISEHHCKIYYPAGVHEVPREYAGHWYLAANGVKLAPVVDPEPVEKPTKKK